MGGRQNKRTNKKMDLSFCRGENGGGGNTHALKTHKIKNRNAK